MTYSEKLRDPRWQKKRLAVLERENWSCQCCGDKTSTLHVHHLVYSKGEPWDAPMENLECLCSGCHEWREQWNEMCEERTTIPTRFCYYCVRFTGAIFNRLKPERQKNWLDSFINAWLHIEGASRKAAVESSPELENLLVFADSC